MGQSRRVYAAAKRISGPASRPGEVDADPYSLIAAAVLLRAVRDVRSTGQYRHDAANWLAGDGLIWLDHLVTGIDPDVFLSRLKNRFPAGRSKKDVRTR